MCLEGEKLPKILYFANGCCTDGTAPEQKTKNAQNTLRLDACEYFHFIGRRQAPALQNIVISFIIFIYFVRGFG